MTISFKNVIHKTIELKKNVKEDLTGSQMPKTDLTNIALVYPLPQIKDVIL